MKKAVIFANCQADGLAHFLRKASFPYEISTYLNYQFILGESNPEDLKRDAAKCHLFIYQPTKEEKHGPLSSEYYVESVIPKSAETVSFCYAFNHGFFPLIGYGDSTMGASDMHPDHWRMPKEELLSCYDGGAVDFALWPRMLACAAEQAKREQDCDIQLSKWIVEHRHLRTFLNYNHPSSILFAEMARRVAAFVLGKEQEPIPVHEINEAKLPCDLPVSAYVEREFGWQTHHDPFAHEHYRQLLAQAWEKNQPTHENTD
jgi:hypothetical protein